MGDMEVRMQVVRIREKKGITIRWKLVLPSLDL